MNTSLLRVRSALGGGLVGLLGLVASGCGGNAGLKPAGLVAADAVASAPCNPAEAAGDHEHFIVGWDEGTRTALETAMGRGVAVVSYSCEGVKVLPACKVEGVYGYAKVSPKTQLVEMKDARSAGAALGGTLHMPSEFRAELSQGRQLNLAYLLVGTQSTEVSTVSRDQLSGRCAGATHFVYEAQLGAFTLAAGEQGQAAAAASMLGVGAAAASMEESRHARTTDGDAKACEGAGDAPVEGCRALLRANLLAIQ